MHTVWGAFGIIQITAFSTIDFTFILISVSFCFCGFFDIPLHAGLFRILERKQFFA